MPNENPRRSGSLTNLIVTFVIISVVMLAYQVAGLITTMDFTLAETFKQAQELYSLHLAAMVGDEVTAGKTADIDATLSNCLASDVDLSFVIVVDPVGKVLSSTDKNLKNIVLNSNSVDKAALEAKEMTPIVDDTKHGVTQIATPLMKDSKKIGVLRVGFSNETARKSMQHTAQTAVIAAILLLVIATSAYAIMVMRILDTLLQENLGSSNRSS